MPSALQITPSTSHIILSPGDRCTQARHTSPAALFTLAWAPGLAVAPLHFHINSSKAWWNQRCCWGGKLRITTLFTSIYPHAELALKSQTQLQEMSHRGPASLIYLPDKFLEKNLKWSFATPSKITRWSHLESLSQFKCDLNNVYKGNAQLC